jgi:origin recognition complex subunit 3
MDHEKCYVFKPAEGRPAKRRQVDMSPFESSRELRESTYRQLWSAQHQQIRKVLEDANRVTLDEVLSFLHDAELSQRSKAISTGFILAGPDTTSHSTFFEQLSKRLEIESSCCMTVLSSNDGPNLKSLLKNLIQKASLDDDSLHTRTGARLLDYDLRLLQNWMSKNGKDFAIVAVQDSEAFDAHLLGEVVELMR